MNPCLIPKTLAFISTIQASDGCPDSAEFSLGKHSYRSPGCSVDQWGTTPLLMAQIGISVSGIEINDSVTHTAGPVAAMNS